MNLLADGRAAVSRVTLRGEHSLKDEVEKMLDGVRTA
jgi:hypothetical protein